jgi:hypothetical protein
MILAEVDLANVLICGIRKRESTTGYFGAEVPKKEQE